MSTPTASESITDVALLELSLEKLKSYPTTRAELVVLDAEWKRRGPERFTAAKEAVAQAREAKRGAVTVEQLREAGWDMREDPADGRLYGRCDTRGAGMAYVTPPNGKDGEPNRQAAFSTWVHPAWLQPGEFDALPVAP